MDNPKKSEAALRANDPAELSAEKTDGKRKKPAPDDKTSSKAEEMPAEGGPELRDLPMKGGVDHVDGRRGD